MEPLKISSNYLDRFQKAERKVEGWQDYAATICKEFNIEGCWKSQVFRMAKRQRAFLEGKVGLMHEIKEREPNKYNSLKQNNKLGNYFFSLFRKK